MTVIPAIDILGGRCVRLTQGDYDQVDVYDKDPVAVARGFVEAGAGRLHIVDLDGARGDKQSNRKKIRKIRKAVNCTLEFGGGIRTDEDIEELMDLGIDRFVIGTTFARRPEVVEGWSAHYGNVFLAGIDARDHMVYVEGWERQTGVEDLTLARRAREVGACGIIYTNIANDGTLGGPDIEGANRIAEVSQLPVILSGGIGSAADIERVAVERHPNVVAVIAGKAIYEDAVDLRELFRAFPPPDGEQQW
ncbi:MAG: 1-(5-phosphoribosyl)-5-((5-phosphoribosylamino)methylideneamino)imidazole-4-carboxamide isomerase [Spirochaetaceae bacterium]|nr:MAG: 1-(5-phosphoribosyl)-5-((5-phosphoribosylamino)methylideneamino)imidazole-4-carboxamide isomerase [Spirochaetaceae bacterium]